MSNDECNDESIRSKWGGHESAPVVFIIGLHRSGTTFLYESMWQVLPVTKLTINDVVNYEHLIHSHLEDEGRADREAIADYFEVSQTRTRGNDSLPLSPSTAEEYGWILKRTGGTFDATGRTISTLKDLISKLAFLHPTDRAILLKNPWDIGNAPFLAKCFPDAKFVFIRREPIETLNSEYGNMLHFSGAADALLVLLTRKIVRTRIFLAIARTLRVVVGTRIFSRIGLRLLTADLVSNLELYDSSLKKLPRERVIEVSYDELVRDPQQVLNDIASFLTFPVADAINTINASRRPGGIAPLVSHNEARLQNRLIRAGLIQAQPDS